MNTAAKTIARSNIEHESLFGGLFLREHLTIMLLAICVFVSGFAVVYSKDYQRRLYIETQNITLHTNQLQTEWGKLLLEQSAWSMQARIERIASSKLNMMVPSAKSIVMVPE